METICFETIKRVLGLQFSKASKELTTWLQENYTHNVHRFGWQFAVEEGAGYLVIRGSHDAVKNVLFYTALDMEKDHLLLEIKTLDETLVVFDEGGEEESARVAYLITNFLAHREDQS